MTEFGADERRDVAKEDRFSGFRARRATARFPCEGCARIRAMPAPAAGPAPMRIARPEGAICCWVMELFRDIAVLNSVLGLFRLFWEKHGLWDDVKMQLEKCRRTYVIFCGLKRR